eukprot:2152444-Amphidinium_carterae.1
MSTWNGKHMIRIGRAHTHTYSKKLLSSRVTAATDAVLPKGNPILVPSRRTMLSKECSKELIHFHEPS